MLGANRINNDYLNRDAGGAWWTRTSSSQYLGVMICWRSI
jgi:hypothetical protein